MHHSHSGRIPLLESTSRIKPFRAVATEEWLLDRLSASFFSWVVEKQKVEMRYNTINTV